MDWSWVHGEPIYRSPSSGTGASEAPDTWDNAEDIDFWIESARGSDGTVWLWLTCSEHGHVQATVDGPATDLGVLGIAAQRHYEDKHDA